jgi:hypothetical protein
LSRATRWSARCTRGSYVWIPGLGCGRRARTDASPRMQHASTMESCLSNCLTKATGEAEKTDITRSNGETETHGTPVTTHPCAGPKGLGHRRNDCSSLYCRAVALGASSVASCLLSVKPLPPNAPPSRN